MTAEQFDRFIANVEPVNGCWEWRGQRSTTGYGRICFGQWRYAHRLAYEYFIGPIAPGLELDHLCRNPLCANPNHLEPVTHKINMERGAHSKASAAFRPWSADRRAAISRRLTGIIRSAETRAKVGAASKGRKLGLKACPRGHAYTEANTYRQGTSRSCLTCRREYHVRKKQESAA